MMDVCNLVHEQKPLLVMVLVQIGLAAVNLLFKLAINDGINVKIAIAYRLIVASAFTISIALIFERNRPKLTGRTLLMAFFCGLSGATLFQNLVFEAMALTSATFVSAMYNLVPIITFILAITFRLERLNLRTTAGKAKVLGTIIGTAGAMVLSFFKGIKIETWSSHINHLHPHEHDHTGSHSRLLGVFFAIGSCFAIALWLIIQSKMTKEYPAHHSSAALMSVMGALQSTVFALCVERDWRQWKLGWNIRLLTVAYSGIVGSGVLVIAMTWCLQMRGPLFVSIFSPLMLVIVAVASSLMLDENLYLGSIIGMVLIVCGLYVVLWGKGKEMKKMNQLVPSQGPSESNTLQVTIMSPEQDKSDHHNNNTLHNNFEDTHDSPHHNRGEASDIHQEQKQEKRKRRQ